MATVRPGEKFAIPSQGAALASLNRSHSPAVLYTLPRPLSLVPP